MASGNLLSDAGGRHAPSLDGDAQTLRGKTIMDQGGADDDILSFRSSDVAHGMTAA
jgi:hypothetical protein